MLNKAILIGRLVADPELRTTPNGVYVCTFRIAIDRSYAQKGGERQADFISIVTWRNTAEFVHRYFKKGSDIAIDGSIQTRDYTDRDGNRRFAVEVVADNVHFVGRKQQSGQGGGQYDAPPPSESQQQYRQNNSPPPAYQSGSVSDFEPVDDDDDLPF